MTDLLYIKGPCPCVLLLSPPSSLAFISLSHRRGRWGVTTFKRGTAHRLLDGSADSEKPPTYSPRGSPIQTLTMDNHSYNFPSDCTPLTNCKSARKPAGSTVVNMDAGNNPPRDYLVWSLCNTLYVNFCCLGFMALVYSIKARDQKTQGNLQLAQECSDKAKWYNILAGGWNLLIPLLAVGLLVLLLVHLGSSQGSFDFFGEDGFQNFMKLFSW
ncbi:interferon-induced transmembrane protein 5 isoform X2 [Gasterosteus aculeatus]|nr:interferon-induced transmembrane protein 5 isoform X3 [Gasterosteus aculeatus aculeatus]